MPNLALFDFDGTITTADTFTRFIYYSVPAKRLTIGKVLLSPLFVAYKCGVVSSSLLRRSIVKFGFRGMKEADVIRLGFEFSSKQINQVVRPKAVERIQWHKDQGDTVAVVSASLGVYLTDWCNKIGVDLICTELEVREGILTGSFNDGDCTREGKARRICQKYDVRAYPVIYAYGDTPDDEHMLRLAHRKYFRWQEVHDLDAAIAGDDTSKLDPNHESRVQSVELENRRLEQLVANQFAEERFGKSASLNI